jgi:hypothetical protein
MDTLPLAGDVQHHFRQNLVRELDQYQSRSPQLLDEVLDIIRRDFLPLIRLKCVVEKDCGFKCTSLLRRPEVVRPTPMLCFFLSPVQCEQRAVLHQGRSRYFL